MPRYYPEPPENVRARLGFILDRLGPGLTLRIDNRVLAAVFGDSGGDQSAAKSAAAFARYHHCVFLYEDDGNAGAGIFLRPYPGKTNPME